MQLTLYKPKGMTAEELATAVATALVTSGVSGPAFGPDVTGTVTVGGTAQQVLAASGGAPRYVMLTNDSDSNMRVLFGTGNPTATSGRILAPGGSVVTKTSERVSLWGSTTGQPFTYSLSVT